MFFAKIHFKNPSDARIEKISNDSYFFSLFAGPLLFAFKRSWRHFFMHLIWTIATLGIGWVFYAIFSKTILADEYLSKGWQWVDERGKAIPKTKINEITQFAEKRVFVLFSIPTFLVLFTSLIFISTIRDASDDEYTQKTKEIDETTIVKPNEEIFFVTTYFEWPTELKIPHQDGKTLSVSYAISTHYDDSVIVNADIHKLAVTDYVIRRLADIQNPDIFSNDGLSKISDEILIATNEALEKSEGFGGIEKVHLLKFSFE